jgi:thioredoxin 1
MASGPSDKPVSGKVTLVYFHAAWCPPCRTLTPALEQMAATDAEIALRKIDLTEPGSEEGYNITALPFVKVYNRGGSLVGTVLGDDIAQIKGYVSQAKSS